MPIIYYDENGNVVDHDPELDYIEHSGVNNHDALLESRKWINIFPTDMTEQFQEYESLLEDIQFPRVCLPWPGEIANGNNNNQDSNKRVTPGGWNRNRYEWFTAFLLLGPKRSRIAIANLFKPPNVPRIPSDNKSEENRQLMKQLGISAGTQTHPFYTDVTTCARTFKWDARSEEWDAYLYTKTLKRSASIISFYGAEALEVIHNEMITSPKSTIKLAAAKMLIDKAIPTVTEKSIKVSGNVGIAREMSDAELLDAVDDNKKFEITRRSNLLDALPLPPIVFKENANNLLADTVDAEFIGLPDTLPSGEEISKNVAVLVNQLNKVAEEANNSDN